MLHVNHKALIHEMPHNMLYPELVINAGSMSKTSYMMLLGVA